MRNPFEDMGTFWLMLLCEGEDLGIAVRIRFRFRLGLVLRSGMSGDGMVRAGLVAREALCTQQRYSDSCVYVDVTHKLGPKQKRSQFGIYFLFTVRVRSEKL